MRRILITPGLKAKAGCYAKELLTSKGRYNAPEQNLIDFKAHIPAKYPKHAEYVQDLIDNLDTLVKLLPSEFDVWHSNLNKWKNAQSYKKAMTIKIRYKKSRKEFYKHIVDAMRYDRVQSHIMPKYVEEIGIRACVYCNAQYAVSTDTIKGRRFAHYELDHFKPKSQYPFLCVTFFNLQPSCANCNKHKSAEDALFGLYTEALNELNAFEFTLEPKSVIDYENNFKEEGLEIVLGASDKVLLKNHEERFYISKLYTRFKKEAAEILWLKRAYNPAFMSQVAIGFSSVFPKHAPDVDTLYWGHDMQPEDVHKRPLNKLAQDLKANL